MNTMPMLPGHKIPSMSILPIYAQSLWQKSVSGQNPKGCQGWGQKGQNCNFDKYHYSQNRKLK